MIVMAFALGIGIGGNILISRKLGEQRKDEASNYGKTSLLISISFGLIFFILSWFLPRLYMNASSGVSEVQVYGTDYLEIILCFSIFLMVETNLTKMLQSMGRMIVPMICQLSGAIVNIVLDPIFIFNLGLFQRYDYMLLLLQVLMDRLHRHGSSLFQYSTQHQCLYPLICHEIW